MATLSGGRLCSFCCCVAFLGVITLKPEAMSMLSLSCTLVSVVAQPAANATVTAPMIVSNARFCFILVSPFLVWFLRREKAFVGRKEFGTGLFDLRRAPTSAQLRAAVSKHLWNRKAGSTYDSG